MAEVAEGGPLGSTRLGFEVCPLTREAFTECYHPYRGEVCTARVVPSRTSESKFRHGVQ